MKSINRLFSGIAISFFLILAMVVNSFAQPKVLHQSTSGISELPMQYLSATEGLSQRMIVYQLGLPKQLFIDKPLYLYSCHE